MGGAVIRSELVQKLCDDHPDLTLKEVERVVSAFYDSIIEQLQNGGRVELNRFDLPPVDVDRHQRHLRLPHVDARLEDLHPRHGCFTRL